MMEMERRDVEAIEWQRRVEAFLARHPDGEWTLAQMIDQDHIEALIENGFRAFTSLRVWAATKNDPDLNRLINAMRAVFPVTQSVFHFED